MIEITDIHIAKLNDSDLRELVARLCKAELRATGQPVSSVTAGGHQNAKDGGIDVRVDASMLTLPDFIPHCQTGYQVKCEDMPEGAIGEEMRPKGALRKSIAELVGLGGAYIIVSSQGSVADTPLQRRRDAMVEAIKDVPGHEKCIVDFYDRNRLATWVNNYPGVALWIRERINGPLSGWRPYGNWAGDPPDSGYIVDDMGRVIARTTGNPDAMTAVAGIEAIRSVLTRSNGIVRLVGLSGMGKTKLAQTLFDDRVGENSLDPALVVYSDLGNSPEPSPREMIARLAASGIAAIVVVDNCNPKTHRTLTQAIVDVASKISLLTIEYDITEDEPEETVVYELTAASKNVLISVLKILAPQVQQSDLEQIAKFSGGNARIALALSRTVKKGETLGVLNDVELFKRLFYQNQEPDELLLRAAEVCSLVYSFDGETIDGETSELSALAGLLETSSIELHRQLAELRRRDLLQRRGKWRAVLPEAFANRLARDALRKIHWQKITSTVEAHKRLLQSFSRRLGYLHDSKEACAIADRWMTDSNWLANVAELTELHRTIFLNLAPLVPERTLATLEAALCGPHASNLLGRSTGNRHQWLSLARNLAYEPSSFVRAANIVLKFVVADPENTSNLDAWKELFRIALSGTNALPAQRREYLAELFNSSDIAVRRCAFEGLEAMFESTYFITSHDVSFGARPRGYGWEARSVEDGKSWYGEAFSLSCSLIQVSPTYRDRIRGIIATQFRQLWACIGMDDELSTLLKDIATNEGWPDGWLAVRATIASDGKEMGEERLVKLKDLEELLRPKDLVQKIRAYVFSARMGQFDVADSEVDLDSDDTDVAKAHIRVEEKVQTLAVEVSKNGELLMTLLPELVMSGNGRHYEFGLGVGAACQDPAIVWENICVAYERQDAQTRDINFMRGFLFGLATVNSHASSTLLDAAVTDSRLAEIFPHLQPRSPSSESGRRLLAAHNLGKSPVRAYRDLLYRQGQNAMPISLYRENLLAIAKVEGGFNTAVYAFTTQLHIEKTEGRQLQQDLLLIGQELLSLITFESRDDNLDHHVALIAGACLIGPEAESVAAKLCERFAESLSTYTTKARHFQGLAEKLFQVQTRIALDNFFVESNPLHRFPNHRKKVVNSASEEVLLAWVSELPDVRVPLVAAEIDVLTRKKDGELDDGVIEWTPVATALFEMTSDKSALLGAFAKHFYPTAWSGSLTEVLRPYREMAKKLLTDLDPIVVEWAKSRILEIDRRVEQNTRQNYQEERAFE